MNVTEEQLKNAIPITKEELNSLLGTPQFVWHTPMGIKGDIKSYYEDSGTIYVVEYNFWE